MSNPSANGPVRFPVTLSHKDREKTVELGKKIIFQLRPDWKTDDIDSLQHQYFSDGLTNTILSVWSKTHGPDDRVLLRVYGEMTELVIDRQAEKRNMMFLNRHGCAAPLFGTFENGVIYGYIPGRVLNRDDVKEPHLAELIAKGMAKMHAIGFSTGGQSVHVDDGISRYPMLIPKISHYITNLPNSYGDPKKQQTFETEFPSKSDLWTEYASICKKIEEMKSPVVFCHNDLLVKNLVHDKQKDEVKFIDFEYAAYNYQAFDIANHFAEYAGVEDIDFSLFPNEKYQKWWLRLYLRYWREFTKGPSPTDHDVDVLYIQVNVIAPVAHFFWSVWAAIQARYSTIDFDFLQYGIDRMSEYKRLKQRSWNWSIEK